MLLFYNGTIHTMDPSYPNAAAVLVGNDGRIQAVGELDALVTRGAEQAITPREALYAYTMGGAILSGDEANRGSVTPGKWADLVVLSGDPLTTPPAQMLDLVVEQTYVGGTLRYQHVDR